MMTRHSPLLIITLLLVSFSFLQAAPYVESWSMELTQLFTAQIGLQVHLAGQLSLKGSAGGSFLGSPLVSCSVVGVRPLRDQGRSFQIDLVAGMPLGYLNFWEGETVDKDPHIDDPFAGWTFGGGLSWGWRRRSGEFSLFTGLSAWWEWQRDSGWTGPLPMPLVSLRYAWLRGVRQDHG